MSAAASPPPPTRGVVLTPQDLALPDWPERAARAGLNTLALHPFPGTVARFVASAEGEAFRARCASLGLRLEYELHAAGELLPRELFASHPELFRMDKSGARTPDANLCVHSGAALELAAENACLLARRLRPDPCGGARRYFLWGDDNRPWCRCPRCRPFTDSDQALLLENQLVAALRRQEPGALLAHLAYMGTLPPPARVRPAEGVFLEWAPIRRRYDVPYSTQHGPETDSLELLDANLELFPRESAQVLEYWLDVSRFSRWRRPARPLTWNPAVVAADLAACAARGVRHFTSFAVWMDAAWVAQYGEPPLDDYGRLLAAAVPPAGETAAGEGVSNAA